MILDIICWGDYRYFHVRTCMGAVGLSSYGK